jgi:uncharacterized protein (TIGR03437 family)
VAPYAVAGSEAQVTVTYEGRKSAALTVPVTPSSPSLFTLNQSGAGQALTINAVDGTVNTAADPARIGESLSFYATGEGKTVPAGVAGKPGGPDLARPVLPVSVTVDGLPAIVKSAGSVPWAGCGCNAGQRADSRGDSAGRVRAGCPESGRSKQQPRRVDRDIGKLAVA